MPYNFTFDLNQTPNRYQAPSIGRWLTPDPAGRKAVNLGDPQTWNMYAYVRNTPTTLADPSGLDLMDSGAYRALGGGRAGVWPG